MVVIGERAWSGEYNETMAPWIASDGDGKILVCIVW